ncbi:DNA topoisomerase I [Candidatus Pacearchaeota archaeon]|nr:DNA topoisomerase I [Candidatus Pacearchaeota archaeon]MBD3283173.1 DNA topoisomerase I [Candidatus Pacearchaeota archaeon]
MPRRKSDPKKAEQKEFRVYDPKDIKETVKIAVKQTPSEKLEKIEKLGKKKVKKTKKQKSSSKKEHILIITEKPQAASKIAAALSEGNDNKITKTGVSYYEFNRNNKKIIVACAVGHLFTVSQTKKGTDYPIFDIAWFPNFEIEKKDFTKKYYNVIEKLVKNASEIIVATDFDVEGEVIGYNIVRFIAKKKDAKRMKFSSLTAGELQSSYDNALPTIEWGQAIAGETRHFLDWLYGINLSRALMKAIKTTGKFKIMSIGRVQGPALKLIVEKEKKIKEFKPKPYWQVFITISDGKNKTELKHNKDIAKKHELEKFKDLKGKNAEASTKKRKQTIQPPAPFDLTSLQTEAYKLHSITPSNTLQTAQRLYLAGLISYPRTSSQKIPDAMKPLEILKKLSKNFPKLVELTTKKKPIEGKKSDPAHPAIIPTGIKQKLNEHDEKIYNLIVKRFISCFCDNAELENKKIELEINKLKFLERGLGILKQGWMQVYPAKMNEKEIPDFNGKVKIEKVRFEEKETKPPKRYSPASIVSELEKRNLGTKATRANIIETLYNRDYIKDRSIEATELGVKLIDTLKEHSPIIIDEKLTREIEKDMDNIRASKKNLEKKQEITIKKAKNALIKISDDFKKYEKKIGKALEEANEEFWEHEKEDNKLGVKCPSCKKGELTLKYTPRFKSYFVACTSYPKCKQTFPLPSRSLVKKLENNKKCEECGWPLLIRIKQGKRPWIFCFNPNCPSRKKYEENKKRYTGQKTEIKQKKINKVTS